MALHIKLQRREKGLGRFYTGNPEQFCHRQQAARNVLSKKVTESNFHVKEMVLVPKERKQFQKQRVAPKSQKSQKTLEVQN